MMKKSIALLTFAWLLSTVIFLAVSVYSATSGWYCEPCRTTNFLSEPTATHSYLSTLQTWDAQWYLDIAEHGYTPENPRNAFYPLFPLLIRLTSIPGISLFFTALFLSTALSYAALILLYKTFREFVTERQAFWATLLFLSYPTAFYGHLIYTESLFLLLVCTLVLFIRREQWHYAWILAALLPLTRPQGVVAVVGIIVAQRIWNHTKKKTVHREEMQLLIALGAGITLYLISMAITTGNALSGFHAQQFFGSAFGAQYLLHPIQWLRDNFSEWHWSFITMQSSVLSRLLFIYSLIGLVALIRTRALHAFIPYYLLLIGFSALPGQLNSYGRYSLLLFPIFPAFVSWLDALGLRTRTPKRIVMLILTIWVIIGFAAQYALFFYHSANWWVA